MIPLLVGAVLVAAVAGLLWVRGLQGPAGRVSSRDRRAGRGVFVVAGLLALGAPFPAVQELLGVGVPAECRHKPAEDAGTRLSDESVLRNELRERRQPGLPPEVELRQVSRIQQLTGPIGPNHTDRRWAVFGTDLGHPFRHGGRLGMLFGDTFATETRTGWRSNTLAWSGDGPAGGLELSAMHGSPGPAREILGSIKLEGWEQTVIPTSAVSLGDRIVTHYMSVKCWGPPGEWVVNHSGLAASTDGGRTWRRLGIRWRGDGPFAQVEFVRHGPRLYAFGIPAGRTGAVHLARVPPDRLADPAAWRYRTGDGWSPDPTRAQPVVPPPAGELSVQRLPRHGTWLMLYLDERRHGVVLRTADSLSGPWSTEELVLSEVTMPSLYAPYLIPASTGPGTIYFTLSRYDTYNVFLMRADVVAGREPHRGLVTGQRE